MNSDSSLAPDRPKTLPRLLVRNAKWLGHTRVALREKEFGIWQTGPGRSIWSGGSIASAYWNQREETKENMQGEWFVTGDRYVVDEDGFYYFRGRSDDMLRVGGKWLGPEEVENTLNQHPAVEESALVGYTDRDELVKPYAFVVLKAGHNPTEELEEEIKAFVKERIAAYKYPRWVEFVDRIPKAAGG